MFPNFKFWTLVHNLLDYTAVLFQNKNSWDKCCDMELQSIWTIAYGWYIYIYIYAYLSMLKKHIYIYTYVLFAGIVSLFHCVCFFQNPNHSANWSNQGFFKRSVFAHLYTELRCHTWLPWNSHRWMVGTVHPTIRSHKLDTKNHGLFRFFGC